MDTLPDHPLELILQYALASYPSRVISACQRFKHLVYRMCDGPPDDLSAYNCPVYERDHSLTIFNIYSRYPQRICDYFQEKLVHRDKVFLLRQIRKNPSFVLALARGKSDPEFSWIVSGQGILPELIRRDDFELFQFLLRNFSSNRTRIVFEFIFARSAYFYHNRRLPYRYLRELLLHNFRNGCHVETSACTGCRLAPRITREWTIRAILQNDDLELLHSYMKMRFILHPHPRHQPLNRTICAGYHVQPQTLLQMYEHKSVRIARYFQKSGRAQKIPPRAVACWLERASDESIEFAARHGLDVSQTKTLRRAIRAKNMHLALTLLRTFSYALTKQDRAHMLFHLRVVSPNAAAHAELIARIHLSSCK